MGKGKGKEKEAGRGQQRRSARICALELRGRRAAAATKRTSSSSSLSPSPSPSPPSSSPPAKRKPPKRKSLQDMAVNSVASAFAHRQERPKDTKQHDTSCIKKTDGQPPNPSSAHHMPSKQTLELLLDVLQRKDTLGIFAQPVDPKEVVGYYDIIEEPMDFGTMRAKLQEGMYKSLVQFQYDVFLMTTNAMKFNSSATVYYKEALAITELAERAFYALRTEPENFEMIISRANKSSGSKPQGDAGRFRSKLPKAGVVKNGVSFNGSSVRRNTKSFLASSPLHSYNGQTNIRSPSGLRNATSLRSPETERRMTYMPHASFISERDSIVTAVYSAPKELVPVPSVGIQYMESLKKFVEDLGPTAQMIANMKLAKCCPIEAPSMTQTYDTTSVQGSARPLTGVINGQMPCDFIPNSAGSLKGKQICPDTVMDVYNRYKEEIVPPSNTALHQEMAHAVSGWNAGHNLQAAEVGLSNISKGKSKMEKGENMDLLMATIMQISAVKNRHIYAPSTSYSPNLAGGYEGLNSNITVQPSKSYPWLLSGNYNPEPLCMPYQTVRVLGENELGGVVEHKYGEGRYVHDQVQLAGNGSGLQFDPSLSGQGRYVHDQVQLAGNGSGLQFDPSLSGQTWIEQQQSQVATAHEMPLFDTMSTFLGGEATKAVGLQTQQPNSDHHHQRFWDIGQGSSLVDINQQPDLALQL